MKNLVMAHCHQKPTAMVQTGTALDIDYSNSKGEWKSPEYLAFLETPQVSSGYCKNKDTVKSDRILSACTFLANKEYDNHYNGTLAEFDLIENILKSKVLTYAIAFAGGAKNGGLLYQNARADLLTWRSIFDGAQFVNGWLV